MNAEETGRLIEKGWRWNESGSHVYKLDDGDYMCATPHYRDAEKFRMIIVANGIVFEGYVNTFEEIDEPYVFADGVIEESTIIWLSLDKAVDEMDKQLASRKHYLGAHTPKYTGARGDR